MTTQETKDESEPDVQRQPIEPMAWGRPGSTLWQLQAAGLLKVRPRREVSEDMQRLWRQTVEERGNEARMDRGVPVPFRQLRPPTLEELAGRKV